MTDWISPTRRRFTACLGALAVGAAGCAQTPQPRTAPAQRPTDAAGNPLPACERATESVGSFYYVAWTDGWTLHQDVGADIHMPKLYFLFVPSRPDLPQPIATVLLGAQSQRPYRGLGSRAAVRIAFAGGPTLLRVVPTTRNSSGDHSLEWPVEDAALQAQILKGARRSASYKISIEDPDSGAVFRQATWSLIGFTEALGQAEQAYRRISDQEAAGACAYNGVPPAGAGTGGCYVTTACCEAIGLADDCWELTTARRFRDNWLAEQPGGREEIAAYYRNAPAVIAAVSARPDTAALWCRLYAWYLLPFCILSQVGLKQTAYRRYQAMVSYLSRISG